VVARQIRRRVRRTARRTAPAAAEPPEIVPVGVMQKTLLPGSLIAHLQTDGGGHALLVIGPSIASFIVERRLGAPLPAESDVGADDMQSAPARGDLSSFDRRMLQPFVAGLVAAFARAWCGREDGLRIVHVSPRTTDPLVMPADEAALRLALRLTTSNGVSDVVTLALTATAIQATTAQGTETEVASASPSDRSRMALRIAAAEVEIVATLGRSQSSVRALLALSVGDVLRLDRAPNDPVDVSVEGVTKFLGAPVVQHGNLAIEVVEVR
jgi:flagellar motor switch protein FliM